MPKTIIKIRTWACPLCSYHQDFEPTLEKMKEVHGVANSECPACKKADLQEEQDAAKKTTITVIGEEEVDDLEIGEKDQDGNVTRRKLNHDEKEAQKQKIRDKIAYFQSLA